MDEKGVSDAVFEIEHLLRMVASAVRRKGRAILTDFDITPAQFDSLVIISRANQLTIGDLSTRMGLAYSTTTDLVDRMERRQLAERMRDTEDKRVVRLRILDSGREMIEEVLRVRRQYLGEILASADGEEQGIILEALRSLTGRLTETK